MPRLQREKGLLVPLHRQGYPSGPSTKGGGQPDLQRKISVSGRGRGDHVGIRSANRCQTSSSARHESRAVRRHHEGHRPEHIEGEQTPGSEKQPKGASSGLALASPGQLEPFQRACLATIPENRCDAPTFPSVGLNQAEMAVDVFTGPSQIMMGKNCGKVMAPTLGRFWSRISILVIQVLPEA